MASVFPFVTAAQPTVTQTSSLPVFREYAYDYRNNCLMKHAGKPYLVERDEAIKIWIFHALKVPRYKYTAHSREYGNELDRVVGQAGSRQIIESEVQRYITAALMVNPYIQELQNFAFSWSGSHLNVSFDVVTVYGRFTYESEVYNE